MQKVLALAAHFSVSSRLLRRDFRAHLEKCLRQPVLWSRSYCLITCGGAPIESSANKYIENQAGAD
jgi:putative transposase